MLSVRLFVVLFVASCRLFYALFVRKHNGLVVIIMLLMTIFSYMYICRYIYMPLPLSLILSYYQTSLSLILRILFFSLCNFRHEICEIFCIIFLSEVIILFVLRGYVTIFRKRNGISSATFQKWWFSSEFSTFF